MARKYRVLVQGRNFSSRSFFRKRRLGFIATRFVEAEDEDGARAAATALISFDDELAKVVGTGNQQKSVLEFLEIEELSEFKHPPPGSGFTFYEVGEY